MDYKKIGGGSDNNNFNSANTQTNKRAKTKEIVKQYKSTKSFRKLLTIYINNTNRYSDETNNINKWSTICYTQ